MHRNIIRFIGIRRRPCYFRGRVFHRHRSHRKVITATKIRLATTTKDNALLRLTVCLILLKGLFLRRIISFPFLVFPENDFRFSSNSRTVHVNRINNAEVLFILYFRSYISAIEKTKSFYQDVSLLYILYNPAIPYSSVLGIEINRA